MILIEFSRQNNIVKPMQSGSRIEGEPQMKREREREREQQRKEKSQLHQMQYNHRSRGLHGSHLIVLPSLIFYWTRMVPQRNEVSLEVHSLYDTGSFSFFTCR